jgi:hypothetical protein
MSFKYLILLSTALAIYGCANKRPFTDASNPVKTDFKNTGEQEDYWAEQIFDRQHERQHYKTYKTPGILAGNGYQYKNAVIITDTNSAVKAILTKGIFYPDIIVEAFKYSPRRHLKIRLLKTDTSFIKQESSYIVPQIDSLWLTNFQEVKFLETNSKQRRFRFWLERKGFSNPIIYFMELTNKNATAETDLLSFINGAKLTFFQEGWVII